MTRNSFALMPELLSDLLGASATFQSVVGVSTPTLAKERIHTPYAQDRIDEATGEAEHPMPRAIINRGDQWNRAKQGTAAGGSMGNLVLCFQFLPDTNDNGDYSLELARFEDQIGDIIDEMYAKAGQDMLTGEAVRTDGTSTHINITNMTMLLRPDECERKNESDELWYGAVFLVDVL